MKLISVPVPKLTSPGGLVQKGGYMQRDSRPRVVPAVKGVLPKLKKPY